VEGLSCLRRQLTGKKNYRHCMVRKHMAEVRVLHYSLTLFVIGVHSKLCLIFGGKVGACVSIKILDLMLLFTMTNDNDQRKMNLLLCKVASDLKT
jgi:hypothetical protein